MTGRVEGKVAFVTGAARGQGRSHAVRLAQEGADIIAVDLAGQVASVPYPMATPEDLDQTVKEVEALDRRIVAAAGRRPGLRRAEGRAGQGRRATGPARHRVLQRGDRLVRPAAELDETTWRDMIDINLTGMWHTCKAAIPHLVEGGRGGSIVITSSDAGLKGFQNLAHYVSAKHGVVGLMRTLALELAPHMIRVNSLHPTTVNTDMIQNAPTYELFAPDLAAKDRTKERLTERFQMLNALPIPWVEPVDISNAVLFLASDEARYITGVPLPVDAGFMVK